MKILMTCFKPFNQQALNSSYEVLKLFPDNYKGHSIYHLELDVAYEEDGKKVIEKIEALRPNLILLLGQAGGRRTLSLEYLALNMRDAAIPDNRGKILKGEEISLTGPLALKSTLPIEKLREKLNEAMQISYHAGTYVCNDIYYQVLEFLRISALEIPCGFVHIPYLSIQVEKKETSFMKIEEVYETLCRLLDCLLEE